jgi:exonuclease SbcC
MHLEHSPEKHEEARASLAKSEKVQDEARKDVYERKMLLRVSEAKLSELTGEALRKKEHELSLSAINRKIEVMDATRSIINRFMDLVLIKIKRDIARIASDILDEVSGKYSQLEIDDDFNIKVEDGSEFYPISRYSGGEIDMIAVSVRVAISEYLMRNSPEGDSFSFLILDEIFGSQDLEHREKMINMLRSLEERFPQIIAISHFSDVQGQFDNTINVIEDEMGNSRVEVI